jgi:hypothetical protein
MPRGHPGDASNVVQLERRTHVADEREQCRQRQRIPTRCGLRRCAFFILHKPLPRSGVTLSEVRLITGKHPFEF